VQDHWGLGLCFKQTSCRKNPETFLYDEETIDKILSKFPKKQQKDDESEEDEEEISTDVRCEAGMLAEILGKLEQNEAKENLEKRERDPKEPPVKKLDPKWVPERAKHSGRKI